MPAPSKLTTDTFLGLVKQCGLVEAELLKKVCKELRERDFDPENPRPIAEEFVRRNLLTRWQAAKLLQGKHRGFILGKYRLLSLLGSGGMSAVYLAEHMLMRRRVAIKVLPKSRVEDSSYLERFHREAQAVAALDHRNIVRAYDVDQEDDIHFLVMEYVPGKSLHELVAKNGPVDFVAAAEYMRQAAEGLQHAHRIGMVHRDIKPGNLLLDEKGTVKLLDLGLARFFNDKDENSLTVKHEEKVLGTADFLSPEQALNSHTVDGRSDIYSLGCTFYYLLTSHAPFPEGTLAQRLLAHQTKVPRPVEEERPDIPPRLLAILNRMIAKKPEDRFQTARDAAEELLHWLTESGGAAWANMNPPVTGSSQIFKEKSDPEQSRPVSLANAPTQEIASTGASTRPGADALRVGDVTGGAHPLGKSPSDAEGFLDNPFADQAEGAMAPLPENSGDPDLAAFLSHLASEGSTKISRAKKSAGKAPPGQASQVEEAADSVHGVREFEGTITAPQMAALDDKIEPAPFAETVVPIAEIMPPDESSTPGEQVPVAEFIPGDAVGSVEPAPTIVPPDFAPTLLAQQVVEPSFATPVAAADEPADQNSAAPGVSASTAAMAQPAAAPVQANRATAMPAVARPVDNTVQVARASPSTQMPRLSRAKIIGGSSAALSLLILAGYFLFFRAPAPDSPEHDTARKDSKSGKSSTIEKKKSTTEPVAGLRGEFAVGLAEKFKTIAAALAEIKKLKNNPSKKAVQIIRVAGGQTYAERIVIDESYPRGIQFVSVGSQPPVLAPSGTGPIVVVAPGDPTEKIENFRLEGFRLESAGKEVAIELSGWVVGAQLKGLDISGFSKAGVHFDGAQTFSSERERITLENVKFHNAASTAAGVWLSRKLEDPGYIRVNQCQFLGPTECGIRLETNALGIEISESIFYETAVGIRFEGEERIWRDVLIAANTFYRTDRAIVFTNMPAGQTGDLGFHNNLFVDSGTADVVVERDYQPDSFYRMYRTSPGGFAFNWTTRPLADPPKADEIATLFDSALGKSNATGIRFLSIDPGSPVFLAPAPEGSHRQAGTKLPVSRFGTQIGAVRPR
jgi:serine/threonine-protein kinase